MPKHRKVCKICGKDFVTNNSKGIYCSDKCRRIGKSNIAYEYYWKRAFKSIKDKATNDNNKKKPKLSSNGTLCWHCKWATGKDGHCPWASHLVPVEGWEAKKVKLKVSMAGYTDSYIVKACPLFEEG